MLERQTGRAPRRKTTVEYRDIANADPACKPPQTRRVRSVSLIVGDELGLRIDAVFGEAQREPIRIGQRMAPSLSGDGTREVAIEMQIVRTGQVGRGIFRFTPWHPGQIEAAVEDRQIVPRKLLEKCVRIEERGEMAHAAFYNLDHS